MPITLQPEPVDFVQRVRDPGQAFLSTKSHPRGSEWKNKEYWQAVIDDMYEAYSGICAYCCEWIAPTTGDPTIDHFVPKSIEPQKAYEWSNFRLACLRFNRWKQDHQDVLDPFTLGTGWFQLQLPSLQVLPNPELPLEDSSRVISTIKRLRLNHTLCINSRKRWVVSLIRGKINFIFLKENAPFIAYELERQECVDRIGEIIRL